jgi:HD-GYP domain-containing protein (c-di-GMP phosphodiesterase class II)
MAEATSLPREGVRTAELIGALSLATDLAMGFPLEHGMQSTLIAARLCDRLQVNADTASQTYFLCLLFYVGCNAPSDVDWDVFGDDDSFASYAIPFRFGTRGQMVRGMIRAVAPPVGPPHWRLWRVARKVPGLAIRFPDVVSAICETGRMLTDSLGLSKSVSQLFAYESERWDGKGLPGGVSGTEIPLAVRIAHVARDAAFQHMLGDADFVAEIIEQRAGRAFDPDIVGAFVRDAAGILESDPETTLGEQTLSVEPKPWLLLDGDRIDRALAAMGNFAEMAVPELIGHSGGVSHICSAAADALSLEPGEKAMLSRAALVHDLGRAAVPVRIWQSPGQLTLDDWEQVRLHAYHTERLMAQSPFLSRLIPVAGFHHERLDGTGYHRGVGASSLHPLARVLAAADMYHAMIEPRPHRAALQPADAAGILVEEARAGRLASDAVAAVLEAAGQESPPMARPAGLTEREAQVVVLLARGLQTKQIARRLEISVKTADYHIQNAYRKMEVSTRTGATVFAMQNGLTTWENSR